MKNFLNSFLDLNDRQRINNDNGQNDNNFGEFTHRSENNDQSFGGIGNEKNSGSEHFDQSEKNHQNQRPE